MPPKRKARSPACADGHARALEARCAKRARVARDAETADKCNKNFPMPTAARTIIGDDCVVYEREEHEVWAVPYNPWLLLYFRSHIKKCDFVFNGYLNGEATPTSMMRTRSRCSSTSTASTRRLPMALATRMATMTTSERAQSVRLPPDRNDRIDQSGTCE